MSKLTDKHTQLIHLPLQQPPPPVVPKALFPPADSAVCVCMCVCVCDWCFTSLSTIVKSYHDSGCLLHRRDSARVLSAATCNTDVPYRRHKTQMHHQVTSSWHRANQSLCYPLNAARLARKQPVPILKPLVWRGWSSNPQPPDDYAATALSTRPPSRCRRQLQTEGCWITSHVAFVPPAVETDRHI